MKLDIKEIARRAGVSTATVSRSLNGKSSVTEKTRQKVLRVAEEFNYKPNSFARGLSRQITETIGVILPELMDEFFMDLIHSIDEAAYRAQRYILISSSHNKRNILETLVEFMGSGRVDGVILMAPMAVDTEMFNILSKYRTPIVLLNASKQVKKCVSFNIDSYQGAASVVSHLIDHGFGKIAMIKGPEGNCDADERYAGFTDTLGKAGVNENRKFVVSGDFTLKSGYYGFMRLMSMSEKPEAIFAANDMMALGAYEAAKNLNLRIPEDVALAGFDNIFLSRLIRPRLTTVHAPITELGVKSVQYLLDMISEKVDPDQPHREMLSTGLIVGGSCGCQDNSTPII